MKKINVLDRQVAELIAAGEVVERPASIIKELVENSIDALATSVTVEIKNGGILFLRVTDNGSGIFRDDVRTAFLRHATSKVKVDTDLDEISTLGFRGEALAAISVVSRVKLITKTEDEACGTNFSISGGEEISLEDAGCPVGTTLIVEDIFYNTPARMKFLKKDVSEGNAVAAVMDRIALSHPEVAFKFIRDGKIVMQTPGDGKLMSAVYSVCGRDFSSSLIPVDSTLNGIKVDGFVSRPSSCRPNRNGQYVFLNGRFIKSGTVSAALEQAYKNSVMVGRFPAAVIHLHVPLGAVDVNVHPAKTEVRFSDEKRIFDCVYYGVKNALIAGDSRPSMAINHKAPIRMTTEEYRQTVMEEAKISSKSPTSPSNPGYEKNLGLYEQILKTAVDNDTFKNTKVSDYGTFQKGNIAKSAPEIRNESEKRASGESPVFRVAPPNEVQKPPEISQIVQPPVKKDIFRPDIQVENVIDKNILEEQPISFLGEAFSTYIIVAKGESLYMIDKHAAHERILFDKLKATSEPESQLLLTPQSIVLSKEEFDEIINSISMLEKAGFDVEEFGEGTVLVRAVPSMLIGEDLTAMLSEIAENLITKQCVQSERVDSLYHSMSCRAAIKAGNKSTSKELLELAVRVLGNNDIMYCPHGRPVAIELKRREIEKQFGRIQ
ncbi:MAG: DNA mismatch repair endonuclease MutL [Oscillospiraceae bacterium]|nr:DNA mismatch repair endonuclease MutL [Oscillospiraceae bacterium]